MRATVPRFVAASAAAIIAAGIGAVPVAAAPSGSTTTETDNGGGVLTLTVSPVSGLPPAGAAVTVRGEGFSDAGDLWVAICEDDGDAPRSFAHCVGGAIPDRNSTAAWAIVTDGAPSVAGPVVASFGPGGSFEVTLQVLAASGSDADCLSQTCAVFTRSADDGDRSQDATVAVRFAAPPTTSARPTSATTSARPTTEVVGVAPATVGADGVAAAEVPAGSDQRVIFSGFAPGENISVTLYSDPIVLPSVVADGGGVVTVDFTVPVDLAPGVHLLQVVGDESARVGIAEFTVTPAPVVEETVTATSPPEVAPTPSAALTEAPVADLPGQAATDDVAAGAVDGDADADEIAVDDADAAADEAAGAPGAADAGGRLTWLWIALVVVVVLGGTAVAVVLWRRRTADPGPPEVQPIVPDGAGGVPVDDDPVASWFAQNPPAASSAGGSAAPVFPAPHLSPPAAMQPPTMPPPPVLPPPPAARPAPVLPTAPPTSVAPPATPTQAIAPEPELFSHRPDGDYGSWAAQRHAPDGVRPGVDGRGADGGAPGAERTPDDAATEVFRPDFGDDRPAGRHHAD